MYSYQILKIRKSSWWFCRRLDHQRINPKKCTLIKSKSGRADVLKLVACTVSESHWLHLNEFSPDGIFRCFLKSPTWIDAKSHYLQLYVLFFKRLLKSPAQTDAESHCTIDARTTPKGPKTKARERRERRARCAARKRRSSTPHPSSGSMLTRERELRPMDGSGSVKRGPDAESEAPSPKRYYTRDYKRVKKTV